MKHFALLFGCPFFCPNKIRYDALPGISVLRLRPGLRYVQAAPVDLESKKVTSEPKTVVAAACLSSPFEPTL